MTLIATANTPPTSKLNSSPVMHWTQRQVVLTTIVVRYDGIFRRVSVLVPTIKFASLGLTMRPKLTQATVRLS